VVKNGLIVAVGQKGTITAPPGSHTVDLSGKTVMPALVDADVHPGYEGSPVNNYSEWNAENWTPANVLTHLQREAFYGISAVLSDGGDLTARALDFQQDQIDGNMALGARYMFSAGLDLPNGGPDAVLAKANKALNTVYKASSAQEARAAIEQIADKKIKYITVWIDTRAGAYPKMTPDTYAVYAAVYDEAHKHQISVYTYARTLDDQKAAVKGGTDALLRSPADAPDDELLALVKEKKPFWMPLDETATDQAESCADQFVTQGVLAQALSANYSSASGAVASDGCTAPKPGAANEAAAAATFQKMRDAGARVVLGTDAGQGRYMYGWSDHYVLARYVKFGMKPLEAIQAGTQRSSELLGLSDTGTLAAGKRADFVVLTANPVEDIRNTRQIATVYLRGVTVDRTALLAEWGKTKARRR
jgi:imidazolonepropionase-like amidohydrolase